MKFETDNYKLQLIQNFPFTSYIEKEDPIYSLVKTKNALIFTNSIEVCIHKEKIKKVHFNNDTCCITSNNKLIIAADENGQVKVFDYKGRNINTVEFRHKVNGIVILNGLFVIIGNDTDVCVFEYFNKEKNSLYRHEDYVNCCDHRDGLLVTGSFDKTVIFYDLNTRTVRKQIKFDNPVSKVCFMDEKHLIVVSKYQMFIIETDSYEVVKKCYIHTKEITGLKYHKDRIYTSSLDMNLKSWTKDLKLISQVRFDDRIMSFDICDDEVFVGLSSGTIYKTEKNEEITPIETETAVDNYRRYYSDDKDQNIKRVRITKKHKNEIEKLMNNNQHWLAFTKIFSEPDIDIIYAVLYFVKELKGLKKMMLDRTVEELTNLFDFILDSFHYIEMRGIFVELLIICTSLYENMLTQNKDLLEKIDHLYDLLNQECEFQRRAIELMGYSECFLIDQKPTAQ